MSLLTAILNAIWLYLFAGLLEVLTIMDISKYWYIFLAPLGTYLLSFTFTTICLFYLLRIEALTRWRSIIKQMFFIVVIAVLFFLGWIIVYLMSTELLLQWNVVTLLLIGCIWIPQIVKNAIQNNAWAPLAYIHSVTILQVIFIFYIRFFPDNIYGIKPDFGFTTAYILLVVV